MFFLGDFLYSILTILNLFSQCIKAASFAASFNASALDFLSLLVLVMNVGFEPHNHWLGDFLANRPTHWLTDWMIPSMAFDFDKRC